MVASRELDDLLAPCVGPGGQHSQVGHVAAVFGEEGPVRRAHHAHQLFSQLHHDFPGQHPAVDLLQLFFGGLVNRRVVVAQHDGAVGAHVVDEAVAVHIPEIGALGVVDIKGVGRHRDKAALRRTQVPVNAGGDHPGRPVKQRPAFGVFVCFHHALLCQVEADQAQQLVEVVHHRDAPADFNLAPADGQVAVRLAPEHLAQDIQAGKPHEGLGG